MHEAPKVYERMVELDELTAVDARDGEKRYERYGRERPSN